MKSTLIHLQYRHFQPVKAIPKLLLADLSLYYKERDNYLYPIQSSIYS